jgi:hypothetical protein
MGTIPTPIRSQKTPHGTIQMPPPLPDSGQLDHGAPEFAPAALFTAALPAPLGAAPREIRGWFDSMVAADFPFFDGTLAAARGTAEAFARLAKSENTRRAYRAGVAAWCAWCSRHALPCLPGQAADVTAFLAAERQRDLKVATIELRRAAIREIPRPSDDVRRTVWRPGTDDPALPANAGCPFSSIASSARRLTHSASTALSAGESPLAHHSVGSEWRSVSRFLEHIPGAHARRTIRRTGRLETPSEPVSSSAFSIQASAALWI